MNQITNIRQTHFGVQSVPTMRNEKCGKSFLKSCIQRYRVEESVEREGVRGWCSGGREAG